MQHAQVALGAVSSRPLLVPEASALLCGQPLGDEQTVRLQKRRTRWPKADGSRRYVAVVSQRRGEESGHLRCGKSVAMMCHKDRQRLMRVLGSRPATQCGALVGTVGPTAQRGVTLRAPARNYEVVTTGKCDHEVEVRPPGRESATTKVVKRDHQDVKQCSR